MLLLNKDIISIKNPLMIVAPLLPAICLYKCLRLKLSESSELELFRERNLKSTGNFSSSEISKKLENRIVNIRNLNFVSASLQYKENMLENMPQLMVVLLINLLSETMTRTVQNIDSIFLSKNHSYIAGRTI